MEIQVFVDEKQVIKFAWPYEGKPSRATAKTTPFTVSKDKWVTKEDR